MRKVDLAGKRFGYLTALFTNGTHESPSGQKQTVWHCRCDCGNEVDAIYGSLVQGKKKSCGCLRQSGKVRWARDRSGERYGQLEVVRRVGENDRRDPTWECLCHRCGRTVVVAGSHLEEKKDCGCSYREKTADISGKTFGALLVLQRMKERSAAGDALYLCRCSICAREKIFPASTIKTNPKSCGCQKYTEEKMKMASAAGVAANIVDGANLNSIFREKANRNSQTGVRGVFPDRNGTYRASCRVAGELWVRTGFTSVETAAAARKEAQQELIEKHGVEPRKKKEGKNDRQNCKEPG